MNVTSSTQASMWPLARLAACLTAISISIACYGLYIIHAVGNFYQPDAPHPQFWLFWIPLALSSSYLLYASASGRWWPARAAEWLIGPVLFLGVFAFLLFVVPTSWLLAVT
jgi:hypothetical protein